MGVALASATMMMFASAQAPPKVFGDYLKLDAMTKGEVVIVMPPREISKYVAKVEEAAEAKPEWFKEFSSKAKPGVPLPFHENLGLTKDEYAKYLELWDQRKMQPVPKGEVAIRLEQAKEGQWAVRVSGLGTPISLLRYHAKADEVQSTNGMMKRLEDIEADARSILGAWTGHEWRFQDESILGKTKENFAIGKLADGKTGLLIYRLQEVSTTGRLLYDKSLVIRFALPAS
jgi:hypothetical protein